MGYARARLPNRSCETSLLPAPPKCRSCCWQTKSKPRGLSSARFRHAVKTGSTRRSARPTHRESEVSLKAPASARERWQLHITELSCPSSDCSLTQRSSSIEISHFVRDDKEAILLSVRANREIFLGRKLLPTETEPRSGLIFHSALT